MQVMMTDIMIALRTMKMSRIMLAGDLHFGHKGISRFRGMGEEEQHREQIIKNFNESLGKRDSLYLLGDIAFSDDMIEQIARIKCGYKFLILGNHDSKNITKWMTVVNGIFGITKHKGAWLSHAPIHPNELRGKINIHGHVHYATLDDHRYYNVSLENIDYRPIHLEQIKANIKAKIESQGNLNLP